MCWMFRESHKLTKNKKMFRDVYEWFVCYLFCDSITEFRERFGKNLFDDGVDCKEFLENYFNINLNSLQERMEREGLTWNNESKNQSDR